MPGIATHHVFGTDVYDATAHVVGEQTDDLDAFLLGNQGPDPLFYLAATPVNRPLRRIGQTMHRYNTVELLQTMHEQLITPKADSTLSAYALGFLCHYILDSTVHPLVYAQQHAICNVGIERLKGEWPHRVVHATIETALDEYVLTTKVGVTAATMSPHKTMIPCSAQELMGISRALAGVLNCVYGVECPTSAFATAVEVYRASQTALDSKSSGLRRYLDYLSVGGAVSAYIQALSHRPKLLPHTPFTNDDHTAWPHPFEEGQVVSASFDELYASSMTRALKLVPAFACAHVDSGLFEEIVGNVNFLGRPVLHEPYDE